MESRARACWSRRRGHASHTEAHLHHMDASTTSSDLGGRRIRRHVREGYQGNLRAPLTRAFERSENSVFWEKLGQGKIGEPMKAAKLLKEMVGTTGIEPVTPTMSR